MEEREDIEINSIDDIYPYRISLVREDSATQVLLSEMDRARLKFEPVTDVSQSVELLLRGRVDILSSSEQTIRKILNDRDAGTIKKLSKAYKLDRLSDGLHLATSIGTSAEVQQKLRSALEKIKHDGTYHQILKRYGFFDE